MNLLEFQNEDSADFLKLFEKICKVSGNDPQDVIRSIKLSSAEVVDLKHNLIDTNASEKICNFFEITAEDFIGFNIDYDWIQEKRIPNKYFRSLGSTIRTSLPALKYIRENYGEKCFNYFLRRLKIPTQVLGMPNLAVSIELLDDIMNLASDVGLATTNFFMMGHQITRINENRGLMSDFKGLKSPSKILEKLFDETMKKYESNFDYRIIGLTNKSIKVEVNAKEVRREELGKKIIDNYFVNLYRQGGCVAHIQDFCCHAVYSKTLSSVHTGSSSDQFEIIYN